MMFTENFHMAIASIRANRLRSFITMLGIIIGVVGVITSVSLGEGVKRQVNQTTSKLGQSVVTIRPGKVLNQDQSGIISGINTLGGTSQTTGLLSEQDLAAIADTQNVEAVVPLSLITGVAKTENRTFNEGIVIGTSDRLPEMLQQELEFGGFFEAEDDSKNVAVIGAGVAEKLFGEFAPLGETFTLRGKEFIVRGVFEDFESSTISQGVNLNDAIFIPFNTAKVISGGGIQFYEVLAKAENQKDLDQVVGAITNNLKKSHGGEEDFTVLKSSDALSLTNNLISLLTTLVGGVAVVSMFVGGIGIMNIMLVSVTERTREIGIRKAIGATDTQIGSQFIIEATVLSIWGAIIGAVLSGLLNIFLRIMTDLQPVIQWQVVLLASAASILVGVIFGAAPAYKAARKDPIEALRS